MSAVSMFANWFPAQLNETYIQQIRYTCTWKNVSFRL